MGAAQTEGERADDPGFGADDPEMVALRAFAAEVVSAAGAVPRGSWYRPRLEPMRRGSPAALLQLLPGLGRQMASPVAGRPRRAVVLALAGVGAIAGALFLRSALVPHDVSLELAAPRPHPTGLAPPPAPPPQVTSVPDELFKVAPTLAVAERTTPKIEVAPPAVKRPAAPDLGARRRAGRRVDVAMTSAGRRKEGPESPPSTGRAKNGKVGASLDRGAIIAGMQAIEPRVKGCYRQYRQKGVAQVQIAVGSGGQVKGVTVAGPLARTRTATCVKAAVKTARFRGGGISFHYPLVLP